MLKKRASYFVVLLLVLNFIYFPRYVHASNGGFAMISTGMDHCLSLKTDGTVWSWGVNNSGQLGDASTTLKSTPSKIQGLSLIKYVSAGFYDSFAITQNGDLYSWGENTNGQLGNGSYRQQNTPSLVIGLSDVKMVAGGFNQTIALKNDGTVWTWGSNEYGQLGNGINGISIIPKQVNSLNSIVSISCGRDFCIALKDDGTVWSWGQNTSGQLGDGDYINKNTPVQVNGLSNIKIIHSGFNSTMALKSDGTIYGWGDNFFGQLGNGTLPFNGQNVPTQVKNLTNVKDFAVGGYNSLIIKEDGTTWVSGSNSEGQLGNGTSVNGACQVTPVQVPSLTNVMEATTLRATNLVLKNDGSVWAWGANTSGQIGDGTSVINALPVKNNNISDIKEVVAGGEFSMALNSDGTVWTWGNNTSAQLGLDIIGGYSYKPNIIKNLTNVKKIAAGFDIGLALKNDGTLWGWGSDTNGEFGTGNNYVEKSPIQINGLSDIKDIAAGMSFILILKNDGTVWSLGYNSSGMLGDGTIVNKGTPVQVKNLTNVNKIYAKEWNAAALKNDGTIWTWGDNGSGQIGNGSVPSYSNPQTIPVQVVNLEHVIDFSLGDSFALAVKSDGSVWTWGNNSSGQMGNGTVSYGGQTTPLQVMALSGIKSVAGGYGHCLAVKDNGTIYAWGQNDLGQLGDGTTISRTKPILVKEINDANDVVSGGQGCHNIALKSDGTIYLWGNNNYGQLGLDALNRLIPTKVGVKYNVDQNNDGNVDILDLALVAQKYNIKIYNTSETYDLNGDNFIDIYDLVLLSKKMVS